MDTSAGHGPSADIIIYDEVAEAPMKVWATAVFVTDSMPLADFVARQHNWRQLNTARGFYLTPNRNLVWVVNDPDVAVGLHRGIIYAVRGKPPFIHRTRQRLDAWCKERSLSEF